MKPDETAPKQPKAQAQKLNSSKIALLVVGGVVLVFGAFVAGRLSHIGFDHMRATAAPFAEKFAEGRMPAMRQHPQDGLTNPTDGTQYTRLNGVVTQVSGSSFTIAGNGTTKTITTDGDTDYNTTDKKVTVNDSVVVIGTDSNGTFTAKNVRLLNQ